jgi:propanol-preferring alcohol dehydrogenase
MMQLVRPRRASDSPLEEAERPDPTPGPGELTVRVTACGVCRTDLQLCEGELPTKTLPVVPGHQVTGSVIGIGEGVQGFSVGERVGVGWLASACGACDRCREGRENLCVDARFTGWDVDGGYASALRVRSDFVLPLPDGFEDVAAAPLLCGGVIGYRSLKVSGVRPGQRLGLYGFGASALLSLQVARHWGCRVYVCTRAQSERERALAMGAAWAGGYDELPPERLDAAVTFAPAGSVVISALKALERGGTVAVNAIHLDGIPAFSYDALWWEKSIRSVANYTRADAKELLDLAARIPIRTTFETLPLLEANTAIRRLSSGEVRGAFVLVP